MSVIESSACAHAISSDNNEAIGPSISCYIRARNEARQISNVVSAALSVADEVIVIDSGSTDATIELAKAAGAIVLQAPWLGFGKQKRIGEEAARHDWLLDLDADEIVTPELADEINSIFACEGPRHSIYEVRLLTAPGVGSPWQHAAVAKRCRLYDRRVIRVPDHPEWDQLEIPPGLRVGQLKAPILHRSFDDLAALNHKFNFSSSSRAKNSKLKPLWLVTLRLVLGRPFYFFHHYVLRSMWREGLYGLAVANICAHGRWLKDAKMLEMHLARAARTPANQ